MGERNPLIIVIMINNEGVRS